MSLSTTNYEYVIHETNASTVCPPHIARQERAIKVKEITPEEHLSAVRGDGVASISTSHAQEDPPGNVAERWEGTAVEGGWERMGWFGWEGVKLFPWPVSYLTSHAKSASSKWNRSLMKST